jgi:CrcB protein
MRAWLLVACGGALGSMGRVGLGAWIINALGTAETARGIAFPWWTLAVNALGSLVIGGLGHLAATARLSGDAQVLLMVGVCGGFTTFSTFSLETVRLLQAGLTGRAAAYVGASVVACLAATALGFLAGRVLLPAAPAAG